MSDLENKSIVNVREMTDEEYEDQYWTPDNMGRARVLVLDDGTRLFASCDAEGNAAGFMAGIPDDTSEIIDEEITRLAPMNADAAPSDWILNPHNPAPPVITLNNGHQLYPLQDPEGNGPGVLFGVDGNTDEGFMIVFES